MIIVREFLDDNHSHCDEVIQVELAYDARKKSRFRATSRCGQDIGIQLTRGTELRHGQRLLADSGEYIEIVASAELVSTVTATSPLQLLQAAYHLGNRHVPLQVSEHWLRYQHDHVLDDMVRGLGLVVTVEEAAFQPESGAYHRHGDGGHSPERQDDSPEHPDGSHDHHHHDHSHG